LPNSRSSRRRRPSWFSLPRSEERPKDVGIGKASCVFKGTLKTKDKMVEGGHVVHCFEPAVPTHGMDVLFKFPSEARIVSCLLQGVHLLTWSQIHPPSHKCHINTPFLRVRSQVKKTLKSHANSLSDAIRLCPHPQKKESPAA